MTCKYCALAEGTSLLTNLFKHQKYLIRFYSTSICLAGSTDYRDINRQDRPANAVGLMGVWSGAGMFRKASSLTAGDGCLTSSTA